MLKPLRKASTSCVDDVLLVSFYSTLLSFYVTHIFFCLYFLDSKNLPHAEFISSNHLVTDTLFVDELEKRSFHSYPVFPLSSLSLAYAICILYFTTDTLVPFCLYFFIVPFCSSHFWFFFLENFLPSWELSSALVISFSRFLLQNISC